MKVHQLLTVGIHLAVLTFPAYAADVSLVAHNESWRYRKGVNAPQTDWKTAADAGLDATWLSGNGGFGYADNTTETSRCQTILSDMRGSYSTVCMRKAFQISSGVDTNLHLLLTMDWDDGFIAWLDGEYLTSAFVNGAPAEPAFNAVASGSHESSNGDSGREPSTTHDSGPVGARLPVGTHVLAIMGLNSSLNGSSDFIQIADLALGVPVCPPDTICSNASWTLANSPYVISNSLTIGPAATLTIEPGVIVQLGAGVNLTVADGGRLLAEGASNAPIRFTRNGSSGNWGNVTIKGSVGSPESRIAFAHFEFNANSTGTPCIEVAAGTAFLDHLTFGNTAAPYIHVDGASFVISHCLFPAATAQLEPVHGTSGIKSGGRGIFLRNFFGGALGYSDIVDFTGGNRPSQPIVQFINNVFAGSQDDGLDLDGTDAWVEGNIFMHVHRNGSTPDSAAAVSGGNGSGDTSEVTIIGNLFFDCDNACTAKQGNFFTFINNTVVHTTKTGGIDGGSGVINVRDTTPSPTTFARGYYVEGNIIVDAEELVRNYDAAQTSVTLNNNILPFAWTGPGIGNSVTNPLIKHVPQVSEAVFTNWADAQVMRNWFSLLPGSPALGAGPNGRDQGGVIALGASISGEPNGLTSQTSATLVVGVNRSSNSIPTSGWPDGSGYTHYQWRLDSGPWSAETPMATPITLTGLANGPHHVEVSGKRDSGWYQDAPEFGPDAVITSSRTWTVNAGYLTVQIGPPGALNGAFFSLVATNFVLLTGSNTVANSTRVVVNGADTIFNPADGTWSKTQSLAPGFNRFVVQALDNSGNVLASTSKNVVAELATFSVGGTLGSATSWDAAMGIIRVTNDVVVPEGGTLSINPGAVILLGSGLSLRATNASLVASGSAQELIAFLPADGSTPWGELIAVGTNANLSLRHVETIAGHVELLEGATGLLEDSYFHDYIVGGAPIVHALRASSVIERRCHVANYYEQLMQLTPVHIEDSLCEYIVGDGIDFDGAPPGSSIRRCTLRHGSLGNVDGIDIGNYPGIASSGVVIDSCLIYDFPFDKGVSIGEAAENITVRNCVIYDCDSGVAVKDSSTAVLYQNTIIGCGHGFNLYEKNAGAGGGHATNAFNNILWNNATSISLSNSSTIVIDYSDLSGTNWPGMGNLSSDPLFLDVGAHDYRLATNSPCIGAGLGGMNMGALFPVGGIPVAPANLAAAVINGTNASLTWIDQSDNESGFEVQRTSDGVKWTTLIRTEANVTNLVDAASQPGVTYHYRVRANNVPGDSDFSNVTVLMVPLPPLRFEPPAVTFDTNGLVRLQLFGPPNTNYIIQVSANLKDWISVSTNSAPAGTVQFIDTNAPGSIPRFYRALLAPKSP